jgi:two-component system, chemotaxis family, CheB/CheR fusion protein
MPKEKNSNTRPQPAPAREKTPKTEAPAKSFPVVGVGASAGGLEAFTQLLKHLPPDTGMAFVLVQHLAPMHESALAALLSRNTRMPVAEATDGIRIQPNHVYVIAPNFNMALSGGTLRLLARTEAMRQHMPIDIFFKSMAQQRKSGACAVVLSGTGSDGTEGLKAVKAEGGITFAQDEASAKFYEMPRSAVAAGCVDFVSSPEGIAKELTAIGKHPYLVPPPRKEPPEAAIQPGDVLHRILGRVLKATGIDFTQYRESTIRRRLQRRMLVLKVTEPDEYLRYIVQNPAEASALAQDVLICVTSFFRDPKIYIALKQRVFPRIVKRKEPKEVIRIWVPGCSTGEEVYSLAICLLEYLRERGEAPRLLIFGTDISERAIQEARTGTYPDSIAADVSPQRLRQFFVKTEHGYQISKSIRDLCIFAKHDLTRDPPFSNLDLISCRNVLIYFKALVQKRIFPIFHYALKPDGCLLLGSSESASSAAELFTTLDRVQKVYQKRPGTVRLPLNLPAQELALGKGEAARAPESPPSGLDLLREAQHILLRRHTPPAVIVDADMQVHQFVGRTGAYLEPASGEASLNLLRMVREGVAFDLRDMLQEAKKEGHAVRRERRQIKSNGAARLVNLEVAPLPGVSLKERYFMVVFEPVSQEEEETPKGRGRAKQGKVRVSKGEREIHDLRQELDRTQKHLQTLVEEQEAANEEMRAANEEILSSNEELQSTNEELETAKEELQSANEELATMNEELENRNTELTTANSDLVNLLGSVNIPVVILDNELRIRRFTPAAERVFNMIPTDAGRRISDLRHSLDIPNLAGIITEVVESVSPRETDVRDNEGRWYSLRVRPYKTIDNRIGGAVVALLDINLLKSSIQDQEQLLNLVPDSMVSCDLDGKITAWNRHSETLYGYTQREAVRSEVSTLLKTVFPKPIEEIRREFLKQGTWDGEVVHTAKDGHRLPVWSHWALLRDEKNQPSAWIEVNHDLTERHRRERSLTESEHRYQRFFATNLAAGFQATREGQILLCNSAFAQLFGVRSAERATGSTLKDLGLSAPHWEALDARLKEAADVTGFEATVIRNDGTRSEVVLNVNLIPAAEGEAGTIEGFILDVTGPRQVERALRDLARRSIEIQDEERQRYARQLHEGISTQLVALNMNLSAALSRVADSEAQSSLAESLTIAKQVLTEVRSMAYLLHPPLVHDLGTDAALRWYLEGFGERSRIKMQVDMPGPLGEMPPEVEAALFRIVQESLSNIHRHSGSQTARVRVVRRPKEIELEVSDEGRGFHLASQGDGQPPALGILLMKERAQLTGGRLEIESAPGKGTTIKAVLPVGGANP